jgi:hypothetical protein
MPKVCQSDSNQNIFLQKIILNKKLCRPLQRYRFSPIGPAVGKIEVFEHNSHSELESQK